MTIKQLKSKHQEIKPFYKNEILKDILNIDQKELILNDNKNILKQQIEEYETKINRLKQNEPIKYILGKAYFLNKEYYVDKKVLIPRPETEYLVIETLNLIKEYNIPIKKVLEIGTGSGIIAISLKQLNKDLIITATDISKDALEVAKINATKHNVDINFEQKDILNDIKGKYDLLISNPPYLKIDSKNIEKQVLENEPHIALFAKDNGLYYYQEILNNSKQVLNKQNLISFEIGEEEQEEIIKIVKNVYPNSKIITKKDLNNFDRYLFIINE